MLLPKRWPELPQDWKHKCPVSSASRREKKGRRRKVFGLWFKIKVAVISTQEKRGRKDTPRRNALQVFLKKKMLSGDNLGKLLSSWDSKNPSITLPSGVQTRSISCPASSCCCEVCEQQWLGWDPSSPRRGDGTRGADPPGCALTWCWGRSDAPRSHSWPCWPQTGCHRCPDYETNKMQVLMLQKGLLVRRTSWGLWHVRRENPTS